MRTADCHNRVSVEPYSKRRTRLTCHSYMLKIRLPEEVMEGPAMKALWKETVYICLILNDVYSVQKEIVSRMTLLSSQDSNRG